MDDGYRERAGPVARRRFLAHVGMLGLAGLAACSAPPLAGAGPRAPLPAPPADPGARRPLDAPPSVPIASATMAPPPVGPTPMPTVTALPTAAPTAPPVVPTATPIPTQIPYAAERLTDVLGEAQTSYAGSIPERAWNVELSTKRLNGTTIAPGELFSFNEAVGPTTLAAGFRIGYGIVSNGGRPQTVPSVGGGICQVATTVFQAAFWAGLPFEERHYHLYWIERYGQAPSGRTGLDATVDDPGVNLTFRNTTGNWIRLESWVDGENVGFKIKGVDPGWKVEATQPRVTARIPTSQAPVREYDVSMPSGKELWVEHAEDGFTASLTRRVTRGDALVGEWSFVNRYQPSRNVLLVGGRAPASAPRPVAPAEVHPSTPAGQVSPDSAVPPQGPVPLTREPSPPVVAAMSAPPPTAAPVAQGQAASAKASMLRAMAPKKP